MFLMLLLFKSHLLSKGTPVKMNVSHAEKKLTNKSLNFHMHSSGFGTILVKDKYTTSAI